MMFAFILLQIIFITICIIVYGFDRKYSFITFKWIYIPIYILYLPISIYISQFWHHNFSEDPSLWGVFGDYVGGIYNVLTPLLLAYISFRMSKYQTHGELTQNAAKQILEQVLSIKKKNYHHKSVEKLLHLIKKYEHYIGDLLKQNLIMLSDDYTCVRVDKKDPNTNLEQIVISELKKLVNAE